MLVLVLKDDDGLMLTGTGRIYLRRKSGSYTRVFIDDGLTVERIGPDGKPQRTKDPEEPRDEVRSRESGPVVIRRRRPE